MDEVLHRPIVSVVDKESGKVLRQLPAEEVVRAARNIEYMCEASCSTTGPRQGPG